MAVGAGGVTYDVEYDDKVIEQGVHARFVQRLDDEEPKKEPIKEPEWPGRGADGEGKGSQVRTSLPRAWSSCRTSASSMKGTPR